MILSRRAAEFGRLPLVTPGQTSRRAQADVALRIRTQECQVIAGPMASPG
jgi:hypothetical protein